MSTVCKSASISFTAVHSYVPALCLEMDGISRYSSSDARSPMKDHMHKMKNSHSGLTWVNSSALDQCFHTVWTVIIILIYIIEPIVVGQLPDGTYRRYYRALVSCPRTPWSCCLGFKPIQTNCSNIRFFFVLTKQKGKSSAQTATQKSKI